MAGNKADYIRLLVAYHGDDLYVVDLTMGLGKGERVSCAIDGGGKVVVSLAGEEAWRDDGSWEASACRRDDTPACNAQLPVALGVAVLGWHCTVAVHGPPHRG